MLVMRLEQHGAQGGAERQRDKAGDDRRGCNRHRELTEEQSGDASEEGRWHEYGAERQCDGYQRTAHFVHRSMGGFQWRHSGAHIALDIFDDDDRVVDDDTDRQHEAKQGQVVQRYPKYGEDRKGADQRNRNRDDRNDRRAPVLQKQEYHPDDEEDRDKNGDDNLLDRLGDEDIRVVNDCRVDTWRKIFLQLLHLRQNFMLDRERVCPGLGIDDEGCRIAAVHVGRVAVIRGADLDPTDVADPGHAPPAIRFENDVGELLGRGQPAERFDIDLVGFITRGWRLIEDTGRDLQILCAQCREHVIGAEVVCRDFVRIEPDAHGVLAGALELDIADTVQAREHVLHVQGCIVRQVQSVARLVRRVEVNGQKYTGYRLADLHAEALDVLWQARQCILHAVLGQHLRDVEVSADLECDRNREVAVPGRLTAHVEHVLDAVDLLFERRRDGAGDGLGRCTGIGRGYLHGRRDDFRILCDREDRERAEPKQRQKDAEHSREARAINEEMCEAHVERFGSSRCLAQRRNGSRAPVVRLSTPVWRRGCRR